MEHHGEFFDFGPVMFEPKPAHTPWPPLHVGGDGPAALRRAATVGDGWIPMNHTIEQIPAAAARIAELASMRSDWCRRDHAGAGGLDLDSLRRHADAGVGRALVKPWTSTKDCPRRHPALRRRGPPAHQRPRGGNAPVSTAARRPRRRPSRTGTSMPTPAPVGHTATSRTPDVGPACRSTDHSRSPRIGWLSVRLVLDADRCTGHGRCYSLAPELFDSDDEGHSVLLHPEVPEALEGQAWTAVQNCPEGCLRIDE